MIEKKEDIIAADSEVQDILIQTDTWAMLLDDNGTVIWQNNLPKELPLEYSATDIAIFSKWYLNDYPVKVWKHSDGLLVIGFQPGTSITFPKGRHFAVPLFFLRNSCIFCFLHNKIVPYAVRNFADSSPVLSIMI